MLKDLFIGVLAAAIWQWLWTSRQTFTLMTSKLLFAVSLWIFFAAQWLEQNGGSLFVS